MSSTPPEHEIIPVPATQRDLWQKCYDVRVAVFIDEQGFSIDDELDELDAVASQLLLQLTGTPDRTPVGTIRVSNYGPDDYKLSRLAVLKDYRQFRFGKELVLALHEFVRDDAKKNGKTGVVKIIAHSQIPVKGFYAKYGYVSEGDEFDEDGAPHQKMVATISL